MKLKAEMNAVTVNDQLVSGGGIMLPSPSPRPSPSGRGRTIFPRCDVWNASVLQSLFFRKNQSAANAIATNRFAKRPDSHPLSPRERAGVRGKKPIANLDYKKARRTSARSIRSGFTLVEVLVALVLMAVLVPLTVEGMRLATLAGEVAQRKELAARIADKVINEAIVSGQNQFAGQGNEQSGSFQFHWVMTDRPFNPLTSLPVIANPNGVNQNGVNSSIIHEVSVDVTFAAQGKNYDVLLSTLV